MLRIGAIGEELEVFEDAGMWYSKVKGSIRPEARNLVVDQTIDIQLADGRKFSLLGRYPGLMIEVVEEPRTEFQKQFGLPARQHGEERRFGAVIVPGVCFKILCSVDGDRRST